MKTNFKFNSNGYIWNYESCTIDGTKYLRLIREKKCPIDMEKLTEEVIKVLQSEEVTEI